MKVMFNWEPEMGFFLMIGDLVEVVSSDHLKYVRVVEIYETSVLVEDTNKEWEAEAIDIANIKPIPIFEEFFEKNSFVWDNSFYPHYKKYESEDKRIIISDDVNSGDGYWYVHVDNEDYDTIGGCDVKYVHQFQQLLRLCGYDMDVVV